MDAQGYFMATKKLRILPHTKKTLDDINKIPTKAIVYKAPPMISRFHHSPAFVRLVLGAIGSGKSVGMCAEIVRLAGTQAKSNDGMRHSRWAVVRNTQKELKNTTIKTWLDWYGDFGVFNKSEMTFELALNDIRCEILFMGLDRPDQLKSLLSLELSGAFVNEAREVQPEVILTIMSRLGRYPSMRDDVGCSDPRLILDSNFPSEDSFLYNRFEEELPDGWELFKQPPPLNKHGKVRKKAENRENLPKGYYTTMMQGQKEDWLRVHRDCEYGFLMDGKSVYPEYKDHVHTITDYEPDVNRPIYLGMDYGRTPVVVMAQKDSFGRIIVFDEIQEWDMGATAFGAKVYAHIMEHYADFEVVAGWGDPAGDDRSQVDDKTPMMMMNKAGVKMRSAPSQDPYVRIEALRAPMEKMYDGAPAFQVTPKCKMLRKALAGGYMYKRVQVAGTPRYNVKPDKNEYSHVADAAQYLMVGLGEGVGLIRRANSDFSKQAERLAFTDLGRPKFEAEENWSPYT